MRLIKTPTITCHSLTPKTKVTANIPDLFRAGMIERKNKQLSQKHFPTLSQFMGKVGAQAHSHFGLKDLGHAFTDYMTSEQ